MSVSKLETLFSTLDTEFSAITVANGYRNTVVDVSGYNRALDKITVFPRIEILFGSEKIFPIDDAWTTVDSEVDIYVVGYVQTNSDTSAEEMNLFTAYNSLLQDIKRVTGLLITKYVVDGTNPFYINPRSVAAYPPFVWEEKNRALVQVSFKAHLRAEALTF